MVAVTSFIIGILMLALPSGWSEASPVVCHEAPVQQGEAGQVAEECSATYTRGDGAELTVVVWRPVVARDGGPMVSVEDEKGRLLDQDVMVSRTSQFMGQDQEVLVTSATLTSPEAHVLIYAKGVSGAEFQDILNGVSLAE